MKRNIVFLTSMLFLLPLFSFAQADTTETEIPEPEQETPVQEDQPAEKKQGIKIREDILDNPEDPDKELFPNIPNPFYEKGADTSYDEEPITFFGLNARWLSDKLPNHALTHIFSFDLGYTLTGWQKNGWGLGMNYEQKIWRYFSLKSQLGTTFMQISNISSWCTGIRSDISLFCYPFGKGLEWLYTGCGFGADVLFYDKDYVPNDIILCVTPTIGWKQIYFKKFMTDINIGYRFIIDNTANYEDNEDLISSGIQMGFNVKIFWREILRSLVDRRIRKEEKRRKSLKN